MDSMVPPSYQESVKPDVWRLIAAYVRSSDLPAASLVSHRFHACFSQVLWGNPASHFGTENDRVYVALTRFKRVLPRARESVRALCHTLHLPPAHPELYEGPHAEWLRDVLEQLPYLQSLIVSQLAFFDHSSLLQLRRYSLKGPSRAKSNDFPTFPLRLLIATKCENATAGGLSEALLHWPNLTFLDLSDTVAARDGSVFSSLRFMSNLQVLKLRHINLRDEDLAVLADAIGLRVRSLDVRNNLLTDDGLRLLVDKCVHNIRDVHAFQRQVQNDDSSGIIAASSPIVYAMNGFRNEDLDLRFVERLTSSDDHALPSDVLPHTGITHLYIANNYISTGGLVDLIRTRNINLLDVGTCSMPGSEKRRRARSSFSQQSRPFYQPSFEAIAPVLEENGTKNLTFLRVHHSVVTIPQNAVEPGSGNVSPLDSPDTEEPSHELENEGTAINELGAEKEQAPAYELSADPPSPKHELAGDPMRFVVTAATSTPPTLTNEEKAQEAINRGAAFAPEVVSPEEAVEDMQADPFVVTNSGLGDTAQTANGIRSPPPNGASRFPVKLPRLKTSTPEISGLTIPSLIGEREKLRFHNAPNGRTLRPGRLPALRTIVLTDVPCHVPDERPIIELKKFISDCAAELRLATLQATLEWTYASRKGSKLERIREIFALRRIILEMAPPTKLYRKSPRSPSSFSKRSTKSSTEDADSEAFWKAAKDDFSFFEQDEECGLPARDPDRHISTLTLTEKMVVTDENLRTGSLPVLQELESPMEPMFDLVAELAKFRKERKAAHETNLKAGKQFTDGYWPGEIKIVRWQVWEKDGAENDYYGNYAENGIYR